MNFGPLSPRKTLNYTKIQLALLYLKSSSEFKRQRSSGEEGTKPNPGGIPYLQAVPAWARGQAIRSPFQTPIFEPPQHRRGGMCGSSIKQVDFLVWHVRDLEQNCRGTSDNEREKVKLKGTPENSTPPQGFKESPGKFF